jgi:hypothetical protein
MFFSDLHVQLVSKGILQPGEQLVGQTVTSYMPWWACGLIRRKHLVLATDQRLILVEHRFGFFPADFKLHAVDSIPWSQVQELKVKGLFMKKKLRIKGNGERGPVNLTADIPNTLFGLLAPMKNNMAGARSIAAAAQGAMALGPASQIPQLQQGPYSQPPMPIQNAPGYASMPPAAPSPYGAAPAPFAPPPPNAPGYPPPRSWS